MPSSKRPPRINPKDPPPFWEMDEELFEELCVDLMAKEPGVTRCDLFGKRGQRQHGVDLKAQRGDGNGIEVAQCKCHKSFSAPEIREAGERFLEHWAYWQPRKVCRFVLIVACDLRDRRYQEEIDDQMTLFAQYEISYEAWSNRILQQKLAPHPDIVARRFENPSYWVQKLCGQEMPKYREKSTEATGMMMATSPLAEADFRHLAQKFSQSIGEKLESIRDLIRRGKTDEARRRLIELRGDQTTWQVLEAPVQALALRLEAVLALSRGELEAAQRLLEEIETLGMSEGLNVLKARILHHEKGVEAALESLSGRTDPDSTHFRAALLVESRQFASALATLETSDRERDEVETLRLKSLALLGIGERDEAMVEPRLHWLKSPTGCPHA